MNRLVVQIADITSSEVNGWNLWKEVWQDKGLKYQF